MLIVLTLYLSFKECVGYGNGADRTDACAEHHGNHGNDKDLAHKLCGNLPFLHAHCSQYADLVFALSYVKDVKNYENDTTDNQNDK